MSLPFIKAACCVALISSVGCAHTRERTSVSAVTNRQTTGDAAEPGKHRMHYTQVRGDVENANKDLPSNHEVTGTPANATVAQSEQPCQLAIYFPDASATLDEAAQKHLDVSAACLKRHDVDHVTISGRADPRGTMEDNTRLSEQRADAVASYLQKQGVPEADVRVEALGESGASTARVLWPRERRADVRVSR